MEILNDLSDLLEAAEKKSTNGIFVYDYTSGIDYKRGFKRFLVEIYTLVCRWDLMVGHWIINPLQMAEVMSLFPEEKITDNKNISIWGADCVFTNNISKGKVLAIADNYKEYDYPDYRHVALGICDPELIKRYNNLKVFW